MKFIVIKLLNFYQAYLSFDRGILILFAPGGACKYSPSCSEYTRHAIAQYGVLKGIRLGAERIWSCK